MVADRNHTVHAVASNWYGDRLLVTYRTWSLTEGWSLPIDILESPVKLQARTLGVHLDRTGMLHVLFFGGDEQEANIYYSRAPAENSVRASAWSPPRPIGFQAVTPENAAMVGDDQGNLYVLFSGQSHGNGLYFVHSNDSGITWSDPELILPLHDSSLRTLFLQMHLGGSGNAHAVWNVVDERGANVAGYYARLDATEIEWSRPSELDASVGLGIAVPQVIEVDNRVLIVYNNGAADQVAPVHWTRVSEDGGESWSSPLRSFPDHVGRNGVLSLLTDSNGTLHILFAQRIPLGGAEATHGVWHSEWHENSWRPPEAVVSGLGQEGFDPYDVRAVVSQGNVILTTWRTDPGNDRNGVWYAHKVLDAPELPVQQLPGLSASQPTSGSDDANTIHDGISHSNNETSLATPRPTTQSFDSEMDATDSSPMGGLLVSVVLTLILISLVLMHGLYRHTRAR